MSAKSDCVQFLSRLGLPGGQLRWLHAYSVDSGPFTEAQILFGAVFKTNFTRDLPGLRPDPPKTPGVREDGFERQHHPDAPAADSAPACQRRQHWHALHVQLLAVRLQDPHRGHVQAARRLHPPGHHDGQQQHRHQQLGGHAGSGGHASDGPRRATPDPGHDDVAGVRGRTDADRRHPRRSTDCRRHRAEAQMPQVRIPCPVQEPAGPAQAKIPRQDDGSRVGGVPVPTGKTWQHLVLAVLSCGYLYTLRTRHTIVVLILMLFFVFLAAEKPRKAAHPSRSAFKSTAFGAMSS